MTAVLADAPLRHASLKPVTQSYRVRQAVARDTLQHQLSALWQQFQPSDPLPSLAGIARQTTTWTIAGQQVAAQDATSYLAQLVAARHHIDAADLEPFPIPDQLIDTTHAGVSVGQLMNGVTNHYTQRLDLTDDPEQAATSAKAYLQSIAASEPTRVANLTVLHNTVADPRLTGRYFRVARPTACDFCRLLAERGYTEAHVGFLAHRHCSCVPEPEPAFYRHPARSETVTPQVHQPVQQINPVRAGAQVETELLDQDSSELKAQVAASIADSPQMAAYNADTIFDAGSDTVNRRRFQSAREHGLMLHTNYDGTLQIGTWDPNSPLPQGWAAPYTPEFEAMGKRAAVSDLVQEWAGTSNNRSPVSLAIQEAAAREFDITGYAPWDMRFSPDLADTVQQKLRRSGSLYQSFLRAQYESTQQMLASKNISKLTLYRGVDLPGLRAGEHQAIQMRPLSSFATDPETTTNFGSYCMRVDVDARDVLSTPLTGNGCRTENECVVLGHGGKFTADVTVQFDAHYDDWVAEHEDNLAEIAAGLAA